MKQFNVTGMSCAACSARVEKAVYSVNGVTMCNVNLLTSSMNVDGSASVESIISAVEKAGYGASVKENNQIKQSSEDAQTGKLSKRLISSLILLIVLMYFSMGHTMLHFPLPSFFENTVILSTVQLLLTVIIMLINRSFFINGFKGLIHRSPNMDTLVALGSSAAFIYSTVELVKISAASEMPDLYFESAAMILTLITVGKTLEARSKGKTTDALKGLIDLAPKNASVIRDGKEISIPIGQVRIGDIFTVRPGESIPVDGIVIEGSSAINESALTGESLPIDKDINDEVSSGTVNLSGFLKCKAIHVGNDTALAKIIKAVSDASATKAPVAKIADKVSGIFVPIVMVIAIITTIVWTVISHDFGFALARGISVLVISCPCALGLATPVAIMVGNGIGAKNGILFKNAAALENTGKIDIVVLDKTGTITEGKPKVTDIIPINTDKNELVKISASLEAKSEHPLAGAIVEYAGKNELYETKDFSVSSGNGLSATINGEKVFGGKLEFIENFAKINDNVITQVDMLAQSGKTPMLFCRNNELLGIIAVADTIKKDSKQAISTLKNMGLRVVMLTGDNRKTAEAIGRQIGINEIISDVLPTQKEEIIRKLKIEGMVAMVGDGINDAPALTSADIGIALGTGTDIAIDAADVVILKSGLTDVTNSISLSSQTLKIIHQNLFWAFFYNTIGIPLAAGVFVPLGLTLNPIFGAAAMSLSSFCVISNALRLDLFKPMKISRKAEINMSENKQTKIINVEGMMCPHCEARVKTALEAIDGVVSALPNHEKNSVELVLSKDISDAELKKVIEEQGYTVI